MKSHTEQWRRALLIVHYQRTSDFTDKGAIALSRWYEEFLATEGGNLSEPLDLSGSGLKTLPDLVRLPLSLGVPYVKLGNNPDLVDLRELQNLPLITKLGTIEQAIIAEKLAPTILLLHEIRNALLGSKTTLKLSLVNTEELPVYIQLLSNLEELELDQAISLTSLRTLSNLNNLRKLVLKMIFNMKSLDSLTNLPCLKKLMIINAAYRPDILYGVENITSLEEIYLSTLFMNSVDNLKKLPILKTLKIIDCNQLQQLQRVNEFPTLKIIYLLRTLNLQEISFFGENSKLESLEICNAERLTSITGINQLTSVKKIMIHNTENLQRLIGIEEVTHLEYVSFIGHNINFLKQALKNHIESGRYKVFKVTKYPEQEPIDLLNYKYNSEEKLTIQLLTHQLATVPFPEYAVIHPTRVSRASELREEGEPNHPSSLTTLLGIETKISTSLTHRRQE